MYNESERRMKGIFTAITVVSGASTDTGVLGAGDPEAVVAAVVADCGWSGNDSTERQATLTAVQNLMAAAPQALHQPLTALLQSQLDTSAHDQVASLCQHLIA